MKISAPAVIWMSTRLRVGALVALMGVMGMVAVATPASAQNFSFSNVTVEGNQRIETSTILTYLGFGRGEAVTAGELNDAAQRIRATGLFETVDVVPQGGTLVIRVDEYPTINRIAFEGNARVRDAELAAVTQSQPRRVQLSKLLKSYVSSQGSYIF